ncbi:TonB-dependent receptor [Pseudoalteromonas sp. PAR1]|uniref:TonB-dependent receptor domain-containing protein n=1 Tax=unclassified Pseudoalteromonas TaxID=194690 RepID=UPI0020976696|nr:TonB-dependent receptor [Pseudoalteromonas sp. PAR1]MCO7248949.1 TonB-dependent receptor [Pseudoalteromonas sp. Ps84H-4]
MRNLLTKPCAIALAVASGFSQHAFANEAEIARTANTTPTANEQTEEPEKIVVTGSRIKRDSFSIPTPLVTMDREAIADTGLTNLSDILVDNMPALSESIGNTTSQSSVSATGLSTVELRDLGANRTLTLIDGRRVVSNSYSGNYVSLNTIPSGMVERVEIISGGASATYGADAVAGVVNIITQSKKEGFDFKANTGETTDGGGKEFTLDLNYGTSFANERGYAYFSANWDRDFGMTFYDRKRAQIEDSYDYDPDRMCNVMQTADGDQCMRDITQADWVSKSDGIPGGVFLENSRNDTQFWYDGQTLRDDWKGNEEIYGINSNQYVMLDVPSDNVSAAVKIDYDLTDDVMFYAQVQYSESGSFNNKSPEDEYEGAYVPRYDPTTGEPLADVAPGYIPIDNPYVPQEILDANPYKDRIYWDRRFSEVGNISTDNTRKTIRSWAGLQGTLFNDEWDWDLSASYGRFTQHQIRSNELNTVKLNQALQAEQLADGTIQCIDEAARAEGCVPINLFGEGSITEEMAAWIRTNPIIDTEIKQYGVVGYITGDLFELPAGSVSAVFGGEYRKDSQDLSTSDDMKAGGITFNYVPNFYGEVEVYEAFAELAIPLLKDAPLAKSLSAETSLRLANYSMENVNTVASYKLGVFWEPIEGYAFRANYARAQRAPTITELMSPPRGDYDSYDDICDGLTATSTKPGHDNCRKEPTLAAQLAADPNFEFSDENNSYSPGTGNENLKEETADTYTFGVTVAPTFLENFNLAVDYYDIAIVDAISQISNENIMRECYNSEAAWGEDNVFCNDITRNSEGNIIKILQRQYNLDELTARGYDVVAQYKLDLDNLGQLSFKLDYNHVIENSQTYEGLDGSLVTSHYAGYGSSKDKASMSVTWRNDNLRIRWRTNYLGSFKASQSLEEDYQEYIAENDARCEAGEDTCISNPEKLAYQDYGSFLKHSLSASYTMSLGEQSQLRVFGGVNNVFDNKGDFYPYGRGNYYSAYGGGAGRYVYVGAQYSF